MNSELVRAWHRARQEMNEITLAEARARTPAENWERARRARQVGLEMGWLKPAEDNLLYFERWAEVRKAYFERNRPVPNESNPA